MKIFSLKRSKEKGNFHLQWFNIILVEEFSGFVTNNPDTRHIGVPAVCLYQTDTAHNILSTSDTITDLCPIYRGGKYFCTQFGFISGCIKICGKENPEVADDCHRDDTKI